MFSTISTIAGINKFLNNVVYTIPLMVFELLFGTTTCPSTDTYASNLTYTGGNTAIALVNARTNVYQMQTTAKYIVSDHRLPGGSYTKMCWIYKTSSAGSFIAKGGGTGKWHYFFASGSQLYSNHQGAGVPSTNTGTATDTVSSNCLADNSWIHVVTTYDKPSKTVKIYANGIQCASQTFTSPNFTTFSSPIGVTAIGYYNDAGYTGAGLNGYIDDVRLFNYALSQTEIRSYYSSGLQLMSLTGSLFSSASATNKYLTTPSTVAKLAYGTSNFTYEFWFNGSASVDTVTQGLFGHGGNVAGTVRCFYSFPQKTRQIIVQLGTTLQIDSSVTVTGGTWAHVAIVRNGNTVTLFVNGTNSGTVDCTGFSNTSQQLTLFRPYTTLGQEFFSGYITTFHLSNVARYTSNFTPLKNRFETDGFSLLLLNVNASGTFITDTSPSATTMTNTNAISFSAIVPT